MIPAKVAASKVSSKMLDESIFIPIAAGDLFRVNEEDVDSHSTEAAQSIKNRISLMRSRKNEFDELLELNKKPTAAEKGSAAHQILQFCDY